MVRFSYPFFKLQHERSQRKKKKKKKKKKKMNNKKKSIVCNDSKNAIKNNTINTQY